MRLAFDACGPALGLAVGACPWHAHALAHACHAVERDLRDPARVSRVMCVFTNFYGFMFSSRNSYARNRGYTVHDISLTSNIRCRATWDARMLLHATRRSIQAYTTIRTHEGPGT